MPCAIRRECRWTSERSAAGLASAIPPIRIAGEAPEGLSIMVQRRRDMDFRDFAARNVSDGPIRLENR